MNYPFYGYQQNYQPTYQNNNFQNGTSSDDRIFVQNELAAQAYLVAPNSFVRLWDSQKNVFYEKRADQTGRPYMETFEYSRVSTEQKPKETYDSRFEEFDKRLKALEGVIKNVSESDADVTTV